MFLTRRTNKKLYKDMKKIRKIMLLCTALITLTSVSLKAQQFEWATGWHGSGGFQNKINRVFSSQTDSQGNLYILGECGNNAEMLNGEELLPNDNVVVGFGATHAVVILKMNPQGEILWKKQFFGLNNQFPNAHDLKVVGDSVVMFMINPAGGKISYFLDTVLTSPSEEYW